MTFAYQWTSEDGTKATGTVDKPGLHPLGHGRPDLHLLEWGGSSALLVRNGYMDPANKAKQSGTMRGRFVAKSDSAIIDGLLEIPDGTSIGYFQQGPVAALPEVAVNWLLRDCKGWPSATMKAVRDYFILMNPYYGGAPGKRQHEPDVAGSPELTEYAWRGALGAAFLTRYRGADDFALTVFRAAAHDRTRTALWVPVGYYDAQGKPVALSSMPDVLVGETGLQKSGKATVVRPSESLYQFADAEHLTIDGEWADAVLYGSPAAWLWLEHVGEAICTWPMCRETAIHGNLRAYARVIKVLALLIGMFPDKPQFKTALSHAYAALWGSCKIIDGIPSINPSPAKGLNPAYTHVGPVQADLDAHPEMSQAEVCEAMRGVICEWLGSALTALKIAKDIPAAAKLCGGLDATIQHVLACLDYARKPGTDNDGQPAIAAPFQDSYAYRMAGRVHRANLPWKGTMDWCAQALTPAEFAKMPDAKIGTPQAIECYWPMLHLTSHP